MNIPLKWDVCLLFLIIFFKEKMEFLGQSPSLERRKAMRYGDGYGRYVTD